MKARQQEKLDDLELAIVHCNASAMQKQVENSERWEETYLKLKALSLKNDENDKKVHELIHTSLKSLEMERRQNKQIIDDIAKINDLIDEFEHKKNVLEVINKLQEGKSA